MLFGFLLVPFMLGCAGANAIYKYGSTEKYDKNMKKLLEMEDIAWVYLAAVVFSRCVTFVNIYPMAFKDKVWSECICVWR